MIQNRKHYIKLLFSSIRPPLLLGIAASLVLVLIYHLGYKPTALYSGPAKHVLNIIIIAAIGWVAISAVKVIEELLKHYIATMTRNHNRVKTLQTKGRILSNIICVVIGIITFAGMLMTFDSVKSVGVSILASAGFLTAMLGLAASKTLGSLFSGIQIALSQTVKIGDIIVVEKQQGTVEEITFTYIIIKLSDNRRLTIPISYFVEKPFENWSRDPSGMAGTVHVYIDYTMPIDVVRTEVDNILTNSPHWNGKTNKVVVTDLNQSHVLLNIKVSADNSEQLSSLRYELREKVLCFIRESHVKHLPRIRNETCNT